MWMHTDSVYGGALIFSEKFNHNLDKSRNQGPFEVITPEFAEYV